MDLDEVIVTVAMTNDRPCSEDVKVKPRSVQAYLACLLRVPEPAVTPEVHGIGILQFRPVSRTVWRYQHTNRSACQRCGISRALPRNLSCLS